MTTPSPSDMTPTADAPAAKPKNKWTPFLVIGGIGLAMLFQSGFFGRDDETKTGTLTSDTASDASTGPIATPGALEPLNISGPSDQAALLKMTTRIDQQTEHINQLRQIVVQMQTRQENYERELSTVIDKRMQALTDLLADQSFGRAMDTHTRDLTPPAGADGTVDADGTALPFDPALPGEPGSPRAGSARDDDFGYEAFPVVKTSSPSDSTGSGLSGVLGTSGPNTTGGTTPPPQAQSPLMEAVNSEPKPKAVDYEDVDIGAGSFVRARLVHGVDCPIGGDLSSALGDLLHTIPVSALIEGDFRGPNGMRLNIGQATIHGVCIGQRGTRRARMKLNAVSFYDSEGKYHFVEKLAAHANDGVDNGFDVNGVVISTRVRDVLATAGIAGLSTGSKILTAGEFAQSITGDGDVASALTGRAGVAVGGSMASGALDRLAELVERDLESNIEVIRVDALHPIIVYLDRPMTLSLPLEGT